MKFHGTIGFDVGMTDVTGDGDWEPRIEEKPYRGDILTASYHQQMRDQVNDDLIITNRVRIVANKYAYDHIQNIKYVKWSGSKWRVTSVEAAPPTLLLTLGGVWPDDGTEA